MKKIRILRITTLASQQNLLLKGQHKFFNDNGFEVIAMSAYDFHVDELIAREKCRWIHLPLVRKINPFKDLIALCVLVFYIIKLKPEIIHTHSPKAGFVGQLASFLCRVPCRIHTVAGLPLIESKGIFRQVLFKVEKITYYFSHWILPNSQNLANYLLYNNLVKIEKVHIIGYGSTNGVNIDYFTPTKEIVASSDILKKSLGVPNEGEIFLFVGRLALSKGVSELILAFDKLCLINPGLFLILVGNFDERDILPSNIVERINVNNRIISVGHQNDVRSFFQMADLFIFPSYREGMPQSLLQACSMGKCCIASDIDGCNEIIMNNINGILIPPKSVDSIVDSVKKLDKSLSKEYGIKARETVKGKYDQRIIWSSLKEFYISNI